jgi:hypothetical protein
MRHGPITMLYSFRDINSQEENKMDISTYTKAAGTFLKAEVVKLHPTAVFVVTSEGKIVKNEKFGGERVHVEGEFDKIDCVLDLSRTNARIVSTKLGNDTSKWIGHTISLETYKTKTQDGKLVDAITVKEVA